MSAGGDITKYAAGNGAPLNRGNYSAEDAALFSQLSYLKFEKVDWSKYGDEISIKEFAQAIRNSGGISGERSKDMAALLNTIENSSRYANCTIPTNRLHSVGGDTQWAAMTIRMDDGTSVISMRGTDNSRRGWEEDFELAFDVDGTKAQWLSAKYLKGEKGEMFLTGHSKGGNDVISAYSMSSADVRNRVINIDNFDGPGVNKEFLFSHSFGDKGYLELNDKLRNYCPEDSVIGTLLADNPGKTTFIKTNANGITELFNEHNLFTWKISGGRFQETKQSDLSIAIDRALDTAMLGMTNFEKRQLVNAINVLGIPALIVSKSGDKSRNWDKFKQQLLELSIPSPAVASALLKLLITLRFAGMMYLNWAAFKLIYNYLKGLISPEKSNAASTNIKSGTSGGKASSSQSPAASGGGKPCNFDLQMSKASRACSEIVSISKSLTAIEGNVKKAANDLSLSTEVDAILKERLRTIAGNLSKERKKISKLGSSGKECIELYKKTEAEICKYRG